MRWMALFWCVIAWPILAQAAPATWTLDPAKSAITFSGTHAGRTFKGAFGKFDAKINFAPEDLANARVEAMIDTTSAKTGDALYDGTLPQPEWLDSKTYPSAAFTAVSFQALGADRYEARGTLTLKTRKVDVTLPFTLKIEGTRAKAEGHLSLDRAALDIGQKSDAKAEWVSPKIDVTVTLEAIRAP